ncbi:MAG: hypothetical protein IPH62_16365 [Ignavibacteriae bacterium]|nr:hypothetical protein [Ignavibacteriota bacterium]
MPGFDLNTKIDWKKKINSALKRRGLKSWSDDWEVHGNCHIGYNEFVGMAQYIEQDNQVEQSPIEVMITAHAVYERLLSGGLEKIETT